MIIIVEGIDRVGKTTLCNMISEKTGIKVFKNTSFYKRYICKETETELINELINFLVCTGQDIIIDRFHLSELVYGLANRKYVNADVMKIDERLSNLDSLLILVKPTDINKSSEEHGSKLDFHNELFELFFSVSKMRKISCIYDDLCEVVKEVERIIENE